MVDIDREWISIECPKCGYQDEIQLIEARLESTIYCHNCKTLIKLVDEGASIHSGKEAISKSINDLQKLFKSLGI